MQNADGTNFVQLNRPSKQAMTATLEVMDSHLFAPNKRNTLALAITLRLPNFHLVGIEVKVRKYQTGISMTLELVMNIVGPKEANLNYTNIYINQ